jgi:hypothetical protein
MRRAIPGARSSLCSLAALAGLGAAAGSGGGGCRKAGEKPFERELAVQLTKQLGGAAAAAAKVRCPGDAAHCTATIAGEVLPVALTSKEGQVHWRLDGLVISGPELERQLAAELAALGVQAKASCGAPFQVVEAESRVACSLSEPGVAWATVHGDGSYTLELALGAAQEARTHQVDEAELDELSGALDREQGTAPSDEEEGEDSAEGAAPPAEAARAAGPGEAR